MTQNINTVQKILRNEITWVIFIVGILWGVVTSVVLPLQRLQIQVSQVQDEITKQNGNYDVLNQLVNSLNNRTSVIESRLNVGQTVSGKTVNSQ